MSKTWRQLSEGSSQMNGIFLAPLEANGVFLIKVPAICIKETSMNKKDHPFRH